MANISDTDRRQAQALIDELWHRSRTKSKVVGAPKTTDEWKAECAPLIAAALASAKRETWEEAAQGIETHYDCIKDGSADYYEALIMTIEWCRIQAAKEPT